MLTIRLSRAGRSKRPFFRVVLTEHTKPVKSGFKEILGRFDPLNHTMEIKIDEIKKRIEKGAKPSERVARISYAQSKDEIFQKFFTVRTLERKTKNPDKFEK